MSIEELIKEDSSFTESGFLAKVDNTFIMLLTAIMTDNMTRVEHKISKELFDKYCNIVNENNLNNERQMYDELNVWSTEIQSIEKTNDKYIIHVLLKSRYMDYKIDKTTAVYKSGVNDHRIEKDNYLTFEKSVNAKDESSARKCPGCGANIDANSTGKCSYCGAIYDTASYDWVLTELN